MGQAQPLFQPFPVFSSKQTTQLLQKIKKVKNDMSIQFTAPGFEPMTS